MTLLPMENHRVVRVRMEVFRLQFLHLRVNGTLSVAQFQNAPVKLRKRWFGLSELSRSGFPTSSM